MTDAHAGWRGRTALVTGGRRGLGRAYADALIQRGCRVVVTSRRSSGAEAVLAELRALAATHGAPEPHVVAWDMDDAEGDRALEAALGELGLSIELLVHAAHAFSPHKLILATSPADFGASLQRNVVGPFALCRRLCRSMARAEFGRVLIVGSLVASWGGAGQAGYIAEKSALAGLVRAFAAEFGARNVLVNMVEPGIVDTEHTRAAVGDAAREAFRAHALPGRLATPREVVAASIGLLDPDQGFTTGQILRIAGGVDGGGALARGGASGDAGGR